ncbi:glucose dehydrogenase [Solihabitans fulvus]|uniref:Glucose dehydrogenase n=1 Tax=Solihabitans fulvus TaxID=1892852 RepID=A0A5B2WUN0_9PSEU|nr:glucose dehydrogenase [Solihabitans fulvus]
MIAVAPFALSTPTSAAETLLSQNKPATASSVESATYAAGKAFDGDTATRWASKEGHDPEWVSVDLGATAQITRVVLNWEAAYAKAYQVQTSPDGVTWTSIYTTTAGKGKVEQLTGLSGAGRYVRMYGTKRGTAYGYSLYEFQVYGTAGGTTTPPSAPTNLRTTSVTSTSVTLQWDASTPGSAGPVASYEIDKHGSKAGTVDGNTLTFTVTGLMPNTQYYFSVYALDGQGTISQPSPELPVVTAPSDDTQPPTAPGSLTVTGTTANTVSLSWNASTDNVGVVGYDVYNGAAKAGTSTTTSTTIDGLAPSTTYHFTVKARDAAGNASDASNQVDATTTSGGDTVGEVTQVTTDSDIPWGLTFLPDGSALTAERDTFHVVRITSAGQKTTVGTVPNVSTTNGEGGLLGLAVSRDFAADHWLYVMHTSPSDNRVVRLKYENGALNTASEQVLLTGIVRGRYHNGGRLRFGPDGMLYVAAGDAHQDPNGQNLNSLNGKILRMTPDGKVPADNPFPGKYVWSYGHRNVQGLAFDSKGRLWESELGDSTMDEINLIVKGGNYGWSNCEGTADHNGSCNTPGYIAPVRTFAPTNKNSPSGIAIVNDTIYMAELMGQQLLQMKITGNTLATPKAYFTGSYGRLRTVEPAPDGGLWLTTTNGDKAGTPGQLNNKILHIALK